MASLANGYQRGDVIGDRVEGWVFVQNFENNLERAKEGTDSGVTGQDAVWVFAQCFGRSDSGLNRGARPNL